MSIVGKVLSKYLKINPLKDFKPIRSVMATCASSITKSGKVAAKSAKIRQSGLFNADSTLFPFAKYHTLETAKGALREDGMILCHMTEHLPSQDGRILSIFEALGETRNSVHFSVNHPVNEHMFQGVWKNRPYAILIPMKGALKQKGNTFAGGVATDFFSRGSVCLPKGTVIVRRAKDVPAGKLRVINGNQIEQFKKLKGIRIVEISQDTPMYDGVRTSIKKLGYEIRDSKDSVLWGDSAQKLHENTKKFNKFLKSKGLRPLFHSNTPNGNFDLLLMDIKILSKFDKAWTISSNGKILYDYKKSFLESLDEIKAFAQRENLPLDINIDEVKNVIKNAINPKTAVKELKEKLKLDIGLRSCTKEMQEKIEKLACFDAPFFESHTMYSTSIAREANELQMAYLQNPGTETFQRTLSYRENEMLKISESEVVKYLTEKEIPQVRQILGLC